MVSPITSLIPLVFFENKDKINDHYNYLKLYLVGVKQTNEYVVNGGISNEANGGEINDEDNDD